MPVCWRRVKRISASMDRSSRVRPGPVVALYELEPAPGTEIQSRHRPCRRHCAASMSAVSVRDRRCARTQRHRHRTSQSSNATVHLRELMAESRSFTKSGARLPLALGKDIGGAPAVADLNQDAASFVAGTTGSGKSVAVNAMILSPCIAWSRSMPLCHDRSKDAGRCRSTTTFRIC